MFTTSATHRYPAHPVRQFIAAVGSMAAFLLPAISRADDRRSPISISVIVYNHANVPEGEVAAAEKIVTKIYRRAGIDMTWLTVGTSDFGRATADCEAAARLLRESIFVKLLSPEMVTTAQPANGVLGRATPGSQFSWIFTSRVQALADARGVVFAGLLGHVIAHEIGHLMLPSPGHSHTGLMRANLDVPSVTTSRLGFSRDEIALMRSHLATGTPGRPAAVIAAVRQ